MTGRSGPDLRFPCPAPPGPGEVATVAPGVLWARLPLPFRLDHVNVYLLEDDGGWAILDAGVAHPVTQAAWEVLLEGPLRGARFTRLIISHHHPDHIGLAGWLCRRLDVQLWTSRTAFLTCLNLVHAPRLFEDGPYGGFYERNGLPPDISALVRRQGHEYLRMVADAPYTYCRLVPGERLSLGGRRFDILSGDGHCPEHLMLHDPAEGLILIADQVLEGITPNVSVQAFEPDGDPLGAYLASLDDLSGRDAGDTLVLPGHNRPFNGLAAACGDLAARRARRSAALLAAAREPLPAVDLVPVLFPRPMEPHEFSFAFAEVLAHVNYLLARALLLRQEDMRLRAA